MLGIGNNLVEFDFENMKITKNVKTASLVFHIEKINDSHFLTGEFNGYLEMMNKKDFSCLSHLHLEGALSISSIENLH